MGRCRKRKLPPDHVAPEVVDPGGRDYRAEDVSAPLMGDGPVDARLLPPLATVRFLEVFEGAVVDQAAPPGDPAAEVTAATMLRTEDGGWQAAPWWPGGYGVGLMPVGLDISCVIEFGTSVAERGWCGRRRWRPVRWYWRVVEERRDYLAVYGPFETPDQALRG